MQVAQRNPIVAKAVDALSEVSADEYNRMLYEARLKEWRDNESRIDSAEARGRAEAREELFALWEKGVSLAEAKKRINSSV